MQARTGGNENSGQYRQISFYSSDTFLKNAEQIEIVHSEQKFPFKTVYSIVHSRTKAMEFSYFLGGWGIDNLILYSA
jgi:hypothetical protein